MRLISTIQLSLSALILLTGCSEKSFTLQSLADEHINTQANKTVQYGSKEQKVTIEKLSPVQGADIYDEHSRRLMPSSIIQKDVQREEKGSLQQALDTWLEEVWNPIFEDDEQREKDEEANEHFTLQHYYDKRQKYLQAEEERWKASGQEKPPAHHERLKSMPVIGD